MRVVLLKDVAKIGKKYEVREVANGHAINFLIPKGLVEVATEGVLKRLESLKQQEELKKKIQEDLLLKNLSQVGGGIIEITVPANEKGHLFAGIHKNSIVTEIKKQTRLDLLPEHLELEKTIKEIGEYEVPVRVQDKTTSFKLLVKPE